MKTASSSLPLPQKGAKRIRTRNALLSAAETLLAERSIDAISIDEIVEAAGVAKGTFYNYFPDKETLQHDVLEQIRHDITVLIQSTNASVEDPARRVARAFCTTLRYSVEHPSRGNFLVRTWMSFRLIEDRINERLLKDIATGLRSGRFLISSNESGALLMIGIMQATLAQSLLQSERFPLIARAQQMIAMFLRGLGLLHAEAEMLAAQEANSIIGSGLDGAATSSFRAGHEGPLTLKQPE